jgi:hypothetical protein
MPISTIGQAGLNAPLTLTSPTLTTPTIDSAQFATVSGTAPIYACRAWVNFNGTGTVAIRSSGNVSSITDNGTGDYTVNFTTAMTDANYSVTGTASERSASANWHYLCTQLAGFATGSIRVGTRDYNSAQDAQFVGIAIFR